LGRFAAPRHAPKRPFCCLRSLALGFVQRRAPWRSSALPAREFSRAWRRPLGSQAQLFALVPAGDAGALPPHPRDFLSHGSDASMCGEQGRRLFSFSAQSQKPKTIGNTGYVMRGRTTRRNRKDRPRGEKPSAGTQIPRRIDAPSTWLSLSGLLPSRARLLFTRRVPEYAHFARYSTDRAAPSLPQSASLSLNTACATDPSAIGITRLWSGLSNSGRGRSRLPVLDRQAAFTRCPPAENR